MTGRNSYRRRGPAEPKPSPSTCPVGAAQAADRTPAGEIGDRELAALLAAKAFIEIRYLAGGTRRRSADTSPADDLQRIRFLADLCDNLPYGPPQRRRSRRHRPMSRLQRAMAERPMSWAWNTANPEKHEWIMQHIERAGYTWTPPPPLPTPRKGAAALTSRQRLSLLWGWPVKTPSGLRALPRQARVLKAVDNQTLHALDAEAARLRLGLGKPSPWLDAHLAPGARHFIVPDPADYYWPDPEAGRRWWQCRLLLQMVDGEQVTSMVAVLPETFAALPSGLPRVRQRRLAHLIRATERDTYLWGQDHQKECSPEECEYWVESSP